MSRAKGNLAEDRACAYLGERGFRIVERNYYAKCGELDIIATKDEVLHFVEVKSGEELELAMQNLSPKKIYRVVKTAQSYMKHHNLDVAFCIDAVFVTPSFIEHHENITM